MSDQFQEAEQEQVTTDPPEQGQGGPQAQEEQRDYAAEAREMGWVPQEEFRGPADAWKDAEAFVRDGENVLPIVRSQLKRARDELAKKDAEFDQRIARMERMQKASREAQKQQFDRELARIKQAQSAAVRDGDEATYQRLETERDELQAKQSAADDTPAEDDEAVERSWVNDNPWYDDNFKLAREANEYSQYLARKNPDMPLAENLKRVSEYMAKEHPVEVGGQPKANGKRNGHAAVDPGSSFGSAPFGSREKGVADLPPEAVASMNQDIAEGLYTGKTAKTEWAKEYWKAIGND